MLTTSAAAITSSYGGSEVKTEAESSGAQLPTQAEAHRTFRGTLFKRSEWLGRWNKRAVIVSPGLISWYEPNGTQRGAAPLLGRVDVRIAGTQLTVCVGKRMLRFRLARVGDALEPWRDVILRSAQDGLPEGETETEAGTVREGEGGAADGGVCVREDRVGAFAPADGAHGAAEAATGDVLVRPRDSEDSDSDSADEER